MRLLRSADQWRRASDALLTLLQHGWGDEHSPFVRMFVSRYLPAEQIISITALQQMTTSREVAAQLWMLWNEIDIVDLLPKIAAPALVLHCRHNDVSPFSEGLRLAASIPNVNFVGLGSSPEAPEPLFGPPPDGRA